MGRYRLVNSNGGNIEVTNTPKALKNVMRMAGIERLANIAEEVK